MRVCATVDMDNYREYRRLVDPGGATSSVSFYRDAVPRFLDIFDLHGVRGTFFAVGSDTEQAEHRRALREIHQRGHEVANHSWSHPYNLRALPRPEKEAEIVRADEALADALGERVVGFRCPSGELDSEVLEILDERGYLYDSTVWPTPFMWLFMLYGKLFVRHDDYALGQVRAAFSPQDPYLPTSDRIHKRRTLEQPGPGVLEIPISAVPGLMLPFYGTLFRMFPPGVFAWMTRLAKGRRDPIAMLYHLIDLVDLGDSSLAGAVARTPGLGVPFAQRTRFVDRSLEALVAVGDAVPLAEVAAAERVKLGLSASRNAA